MYKKRLFITQVVYLERQLRFNKKKCRKINYLCQSKNLQLVIISEQLVSFQFLIFF